MYEKQIWEDRSVEKPLTYLLSNNEDGSITLTPFEGNIYKEGSKTNATRMNHIEDGIEKVEQDIQLEQQARELMFNTEKLANKLAMSQLKKEAIQEAVQQTNDNLVNFGLGTVCKNIGGKDLDSICGANSGFYAGSNLGNAPNNATANFFVMHMALNDTYQKQIASSVNSNTLYIRTRNSNGWNEWRQL